MFVIFFIVYAIFIAWASISCYKKMLYKEKQIIHKLAKKSLFGVVISGFVGLASLVLLNNDLKEFYLDFHVFSGLIQIIALFAFITSVVLYIVFWNNSPSHSLIKQYQVKNKNRQKFEQELAETDFEISKKIECDSEFGFFIDMNKRAIAICDYLFGNKFVLSYAEIINCEIIEDNNVVFIGDSKTFNKVKSLKIRIITNDVVNAMRTVYLIQDEISKDSNYYKAVINFAQEVYSAIFSLTSERNNTGLISQTASDLYIALEKMAELRDKNIITEEEFRTKKEELLKKI